MSDSDSRGNVIDEPALNDAQASQQWRANYQRGYLVTRRDPHTRRALSRALTAERRPLRILDVGCGSCSYLDIYREHCDIIELLDTTDMSHRFDHIEAVTFTRGSALELRQLFPGEFDAVISEKVIHNIPRELHADVAREVAAMMRQGGLGIVTVASSDDPAQHEDLPIPGAGPREFTTGIREGFQSYRFYFDRAEAIALFEPWCDVRSVTQFTAQSGLPQHGDRHYFRLELRRNEKQIKTST